jgi:hypothetical protein
LHINGELIRNLRHNCFNDNLFASLTDWFDFSREGSCYTGIINRWVKE